MNPFYDNPEPRANPPDPGAGTALVSLCGGRAGQFFLLTGILFAWVQGHHKNLERKRQRLLMDARLPDPGVTAAEEVSTDEATPVEVGIYVERIPEISTRAGSWKVVFDVWFRWRGEVRPGEDFVLVEGTVESLEKLAEFHEEDRHYERYRVTALIDKAFSVRHFPRDGHLLTVSLEHGEWGREKLLLVPDQANSGVSSRVEVPGYDIRRWQLIEKPHSYRSTRGDPRLPAGTKSTYSQLRLGITISRDGWGLYLKMFQPLYVAVTIALLACFIKPTDVDPRFGLGVGALFAAVANSYIVSNFVPDTGEVALADVVNVMGIFTILVTLIESTVSLYLYDRCGEVALSERLDRYAFSIMAGGFALTNLAMLAPNFG